MTQAQPGRPRSEENGGTRILTAFGETPAQIQTELYKALRRFAASIPEHQSHWQGAPAEGRWSPAQVTEHVLLVNEGVSKIVSLLLSDKPLRPVPTTPGETVGGKRVAPAGLEPAAAMGWAELEPRWQASMALLTGLAARLEGADLSRRYFHPFLGELDAHDWTRMATFHTRHHRRQLSEGQPEERAAE
ncbi:DinB family protein [Deinococcus sp.]|uniref:DinB family protein n=1 Tax=Deinococcus sp. TaxID=47478 RepID=UPI003C79C780